MSIGVCAIFTKQKPKSHEIGLGHKLIDSEGRSILVEFKNFAFINTYFPSGTSGEGLKDISKTMTKSHMKELATTASKNMGQGLFRGVR